MRAFWGLAAIACAMVAGACGSSKSRQDAGGTMSDGLGSNEPDAGSSLPADAGPRPDGTPMSTGTGPFAQRWATFYGNTGDEWASGAAVTPTGEVIVVGYATGTAFATVNPGGAYVQSTYGGGSYDAVIAKFSATGALVWATYYGGSGKDLANAVAVDGQGNVFVAGQTSSTDLPVQDPGGGAYYQGTKTGSYEIGWIARFDASGQRTWATYYGGSNFNDFINAIAVDPITGELYAVGRSSSSDFPLHMRAGAYFQNKATGSYDDYAFLLRFSNTGVRDWATLYGTAPDDNEATGVAVDAADGGVVMVGWTGSAAFPLQNPGGSAFHQNMRKGAYDGFVVRFHASGERHWATLLGGDGEEVPGGATVGPDGQIVVVGFTGSSNFPVLDPGNGAYTQAYGGGANDGFVTRLSRAAVLEWSCFLGGTGLDEMYAAVIDGAGRTFVIGEANGTMPTLDAGGGGYFQSSGGGFREAYLAEFSAAGAMTWATLYGAAADDLFLGIGLAPEGDLRIGGWSSSSGFPTSDPGGGAYFDDTIASKDLVIVGFDR